MKNKKLLLSCLATFLPIVICTIFIFFIRLMVLKNYNMTNGILCFLIIGLLFVVLSIISFIINIRLDKKTLKIIFSIISIIFILIGTLFTISLFSEYKYSKNSDKVINDFIKKIEKESYSKLSTCYYCNYKNGDIVSSDEYDIEDDSLQQNELSCNWYTEIVDSNSNDIKVHIGCWSISNNHIYYYKSKDFNNELL